jgi:serine phosphatase RsbU (regulator of sigma subunit)
MYKQVEIIEFQEGNRFITKKISNYLKDSTNYFLLKSGGIVEDINYKKSNEEWENSQENNRLKEIQRKSDLKIEGFRIELKIQKLEKEKAVKEKLLISQASKLKEAEIAKQKVITSLKQKELDLSKQKQKVLAIEQLNKEAVHKTELKQNSIILSSTLVFLLIVLLFTVFVFRSLQNTKKQRNLIIIKEMETHKQKKLVEEKNNEILASIEYALRIQTAILPPQKIVKQYLENSFILYKPKDIVAGDFYWMDSVKLKQNGEEIILFAACDCTGHGVPGAMVSVVCHNALNRAVREFGLTQPAAILDKTAEIVLENFSKSEDEIHDGMDISICALNTKTNTLEWAGAYNPLLLITNGQLTETKADKQCIGFNDNVKPFTNHQFNLQPNTSIYLFTDGFADQFGGQRERKLTKNRFRELLLSIQHLPIQQQSKELDEFITNYKKETEQTDDILVIGVRV